MALEETTSIRDRLKDCWRVRWGIAEYFGIDPTAVRVLWVLLSILPGAVICGLIAYVVAWVVMPTSPVSAPAAGVPTAAASPQ